MPIFKAAFAAIALTAMAACVPGIEVGRSAPQSLAVAGEALVIAGPPGYCIDRRASRIDGDGAAFVLMGSCARIAGNARAPRPSVPGILTVTVSESVTTPETLSALPAELEAFFRTPDGRATLGRADDTGAVEVLETRVRGDALYLRARDPGGARDGMAAEYWRALFGVKGRVLSVSVTGFADSPISTDAGWSMLDAVTDRIRRESALRGTVAG